MQEKRNSTTATTIQELNDVEAESEVTPIQAASHRAAASRLDNLDHRS